VEYRPKGIVLSRPGEVMVALEPLEALQSRSGCHALIPAG
jgi:hypothetical protein